MKKVFLLFICYISLPAFGQYKQGPPLLYRHLPKAGDSALFYYLQFDTLLNPGPGGANAHWEFLNLSRADSFDTIIYLSMPKDTPFKIFKTATFRTFQNPFAYNYLDDNFDVFNNYRADSSGLYQLGNSISTPIDTSFNPQFLYDSFLPVKNLMRVPFYYGDFDTGHYYLHANILETNAGYLIQISKDSSVCDGFGTLKLPGALFDSVLRIHYISTYMPEPYGDLINSSIDKYCWYDVSNRGQGLRIPLLEICTQWNCFPVRTFQSGLTDPCGPAYKMLVSYRGDSIIPKALPKAHIKNTSGIKAYYDNGKKAIVVKSDVDVNNSHWQIVNMLGRQLMAGTINLRAGMPYNINCMGLEPAEYIFQCDNKSLLFLIL